MRVSRKGRYGLTRRRVAHSPAQAVQPHDRAKRRPLDLARPFLAELGVTDASAG